MRTKWLDSVERKHWMWDAYRRPYLSQGVFVFFDTKEAMIVCMPASHERRLYANYDVEIGYPSEMVGGFLSPDGERVSKKSLFTTLEGTVSNEPFLWDKATGHVVAIKHARTPKYKPPWDRAPEVAREHALVYWAGEEARPIANEVSVITRIKLSKEQKERKAEFCAMCEAVRALKGLRTDSGLSYFLGGFHIYEHITKPLYFSDAPIAEIVQGINDAILVYCTPENIPDLQLRRFSHLLKV
jgi:hypothetical protein